MKKFALTTVFLISALAQARSLNANLKLEGPKVLSILDDTISIGKDVYAIEEQSAERLTANRTISGAQGTIKESLVIWRDASTVASFKENHSKWAGYKFFNFGNFGEIDCAASTNAVMELDRTLGDYTKVTGNCLSLSGDE